MKIVDFIYCDDIRQEILNKVTLVGIYNDKIVLPSDAKFPVKLRLGVYVRLLLDGSDSNVTGFRFTIGNNGKEIATVDAVASAPIKDNAPMVLNFMFQELPIFGFGEISVRLMALENNRVVQELKPEMSMHLVQGDAVLKPITSH